MTLKLPDYTFSGNHPILVLDFPSHFVCEANSKAIIEVQALIALPFLLTSFGSSQYKTEFERASLKEGGATCWPEAVQYDLVSYT